MIPTKLVIVDLAAGASGTGMTFWPNFQRSLSLSSSLSDSDSEAEETEEDPEEDRDGEEGVEVMAEVLVIGEGMAVR